MPRSIEPYLHSHGQRRSLIDDIAIDGSPSGSSPSLQPDGYGPAGMHSRSKSCGLPRSSRSTRNSEAISSKSARSEKRDTSMPSTPSRSAGTRTRSTAYSSLEASPPKNIPASHWSGPSYWELSHNFPGVHDVALEPHSRCIGRKKEPLRCKNSSRCGKSASDAIKLIRGVPQIDALEEIAQNLLCKRNHQYQKRAIAERWLEQFTVLPGSPDSAVSLDDYGFWETPESRSDDTVTTATTPSPSSHRNVSSSGTQASPTAARHTMIAMEQSSPPRMHGISRHFGEDYAESRRAGTTDYDFSLEDTGGRQVSNDTFAHYFGSDPLGEQNKQGIPNRTQLHPQNEGATFAEDSNSTNDSTEQAESPDEVTSPNLKEILNIVNRTCICWNRTKPGRCRNRISEKRWSKANGLLDSLAGHKLPRQAKAYLSGLEELATVVLCWQHQKWAREEVNQWKSTIAVYTDCPELGPGASPLPAPQVPPSTTAVPKRTEKAARRQPETAATQPERSSPYTRLDVDTEFVESDGQPVQVGGFQNYWAEGNDKIVSMRSSLAKALTPRELHGGYIYIYWYPGNFGLLKIGITKRTVAVRLEEWRRSCGRKPNLIYPETSEQAIWTPHIYRVEALVKAELRHDRKKGPMCRKCRKRHTEWFEAEPERATAVVRRWSEWMMQRPYRDPGGADGLWLLKDMSDTEMSALSHPPVPAVETKPKTRSSRPSLLSSASSRAKPAPPSTGLRRSPRLARKSSPTSAAKASTTAGQETPASSSAHYLFSEDFTRQTRSRTAAAASTATAPNP
ncbi:MAG: hypothetical protein M1813_003276 [Trichoglossum hirsutum]|nr:MAG: hypothetical protein M1813_003276 [Trichoglossum hirsutum]